MQPRSRPTSAPLSRRSSSGSPSGTPKRERPTSAGTRSSRAPSCSSEQRSSRLIATQKRKDDLTDEDIIALSRCSPLELRRIRVERSKNDPWAEEARTDAALFEVETLHAQESHRSEMQRRKSELDAQAAENRKMKDAALAAERARDRERLQAEMKNAADWFNYEDALAKKIRHARDEALKESASERVKVNHEEKELRAEWARRAAVEVETAKKEKLLEAKKVAEKRLAARRIAAQDRYDYIQRKKAEHAQRFESAVPSSGWWTASASTAKQRSSASQRPASAASVRSASSMCSRPPTPHHGTSLPSSGGGSRPNRNFSPTRHSPSIERSGTEDITMSNRAATSSSSSIVGVGGGNMLSILRRHKHLCSRSASRQRSLNSRSSSNASTLAASSTPTVQGIFAVGGGYDFNALQRRRRDIQRSLAQSLQTQIDKKRERLAQEQADEKRLVQECIRAEMLEAEERQKRELKQVREAREAIVAGLDKQLAEQTRRFVHCEDTF